MKALNRNTAPPLPQHPVKVIQFGEGNFLRGFVDWMIDLLNEQSLFNGSVAVVQPIEHGIVHLLNEQDGLYHLLLKGIKGGKPTEEQRLISCISAGMNPYQNYEAFLQLAENPKLELIISNTTEAGISFLESDRNAQTLPHSFPGKLTALLHHRFIKFNGAADKGLVIIPCELIDKNGEALRDAVLAYARHWELCEGFIQWIWENNIFCNTLVDRIVPGYPKDTIQEIQEGLGYQDKLVVMAEPFHLWVIEGPDAVREKFPADKAGLQVKFVKDQSPYRTRKVRILNGAHTAMVPVAYLQGLRTVREAVEDPHMGPFIRETIFEEIIPTLDLPQEELEQFANDVMERFQNPFIRHELSAIALNSVSKFKVRVLPSILEFHQRKAALPQRLVRAFAALILFYRGEWQGQALPVNDAPDITAFFSKAWEKASLEQVVQAVLSNKHFWDQDLSEVPGLRTAVTTQMEQLQQGARTAHSPETHTVNNAS